MDDLGGPTPIFGNTHMERIGAHLFCHKFILLFAGDGLHLRWMDGLHQGPKELLEPVEYVC